MRRRAEWYRHLGEPPRQRRRRWVRNVPATPWRWRWEIGIPAGVDVLAETTHPLVAGGCVVALGVLGALSGPGPRHWLGLRAWAVMLQHRLRVGMSQCDLTAWSGRLPAIVRTRVVDRGVVTTVWVPAGLGVHDFREAAPNLAVACWAAGVEIARHPRHSQLILVLVRPRETDV